jgi:ATP-dependent Clp protease ATP-binding subunit ClpC
MGEVERRVTALIEEASQDGILLFIDEVHSIVGSGGHVGRSDLASLLKPSLARGDFGCIAATTDDEYRRFIEADAALERRFQPIRVQELSVEQTLEVLRALRDELARLRGVQVGDDVLRRLVDFAAQNMRNRFFPDKGVDLLEQCVAYAVTQGHHAVDVSDASTVAQRLVGMPLDAGERIRALAERLRGQALLQDDDAAELMNRLEVSLRGLDVRPARPNATVLLTGDAAERGAALAEALAETLLGGAERVVTIDFSRFTHHSDVTLLLGAPPGYVGYSDSLAIHRVAQMPWCVLRCENVDACHSSVREILSLALEEGFFTDSRSRRVFLSDAVVLLTAGVRPGAAKVMGFAAEGPASKPADSDVRSAVAEVLGEELIGHCDLVVHEVPGSGDADARRLAADDLLSELRERYLPHGLELTWDGSVVDWLLAESAGGGRREWERLLDHRLSPLLVPHLQEGRGTTLLISCDRGELQVRAETRPK